MDVDIGFWLTLAVFVCVIIWVVDRFTPLRDSNVPYAASVADFFNSLLPVFVVVLVIRSFVVEPFTIPSGSMRPTLQVHDFILVNRFAYGLRLPVTNTRIIPVGTPERGDVMVFRYPEDQSVDFIKRVVGLPGDTVEVRDRQLYINGDPVARRLQQDQRSGDVQERIFKEKLGDQVHLMRRAYPINPYTDKPMARGKEGTWQVPDDHYFVMGDNRNNSRDSRYWGTVPDKLVLGKAFLIWMNWGPLWSLPDLSRDGSIDQQGSWQEEQ